MLLLPYPARAITRDSDGARFHARRCDLSCLDRTAETLLSAGQARAASRLLRQALQQGYDPLGHDTYAHACFTQHLYLLKSSGNEVSLGDREAALRPFVLLLNQPTAVACVEVVFR